MIPEHQLEFDFTEAPSQNLKDQTGSDRRVAGPSVSFASPAPSNVIAFAQAAAEISMEKETELLARIVSLLPGAQARNFG
jgi:hypothetical protein